VSPVIATVILVAVAITVAVAVAYWMGGIAGQYTKFEKIEVQSAICEKEANGNWTIKMKLKNTGTATATLTNAFINDVEVDQYGASGVVQDQRATNMTQQQSITSGQTKIIEFYIDKSGTTLSSGTVINIKLHSAAGMDYIKLIELV